MRLVVAVMLMLFGNMGIAQMPAPYPEAEAAAAWRALAAGYVRKALKEQKLDRDPVLNARADAIMASVGAAVAAIDPRYAESTWRVILIEGFGRGAAAFPGETIIVDSNFVRRLALDDHELALILAHEAAHVISGHALAKLSFMAEILGMDKVPTARTALLEFLAGDSYAEVFRPKARMQEREADSIGAAIFYATGYDALRAMRLFDKLSAVEARTAGQAADTHDSALARKQIVATVIADLQQTKPRSGAAQR